MLNLLFAKSTLAACALRSRVSRVRATLKAPLNLVVAKLRNCQNTKFLIAAKNSSFTVYGCVHSSVVFKQHEYGAIDIARAEGHTAIVDILLKNAAYYNQAANNVPVSWKKCLGKYM